MKMHPTRFLLFLTLFLPGLALGQVMTVKGNMARLIPVPPKYTIVDSTQGDLDQDGVDELVVAYNTAPEDEIHGVPRELIIYKQQNGVWTFWKCSREALFGSKDGGMMGDPYGDMEIADGHLSITQNGGSSWKWSQTDTYRCEDDECYLIGFTSTNGKPCAYWQSVDFELLSGHVAVTKEFEDCDSEAIFIKENETFTTEKFRITLETRQRKELVVTSPKFGHQIYLAIGRQ